MKKNRFKKAVSKYIKNLHLVVKVNKMHAVLPDGDLQPVRANIITQDKYNPAFYMHLFDTILSVRNRLHLTTNAENIAIVIPLFARPMCYRYLLTCEGFRSPFRQAPGRPDQFRRLQSEKNIDAHMATEELYGSPIYFNGVPGKILIYDQMGDGKIYNIEIKDLPGEVESYTRLKGGDRREKNGGIKRISNE